MKLTQMKTPGEQPLVEFEYDDWARRALADAAVSDEELKLYQKLREADV